MPILKKSQFSDQFCARNDVPVEPKVVPAVVALLVAHAVAGEQALGVVHLVQPAVAWGPPVFRLQGRQQAQGP